MGVWKISRRVLVVVIRMYQKIFSPDHSFWAKKIYPYGYCKYYPSCSEYARQVVQKQGVIKGGLRAFWRVLRCNPWSKGGEDLP